MGLLTIVLLFFNNINNLKDFLRLDFEKAVLNTDLNSLKRIDLTMRKNHQIVQGKLLAKTWEDKFALYKTREVARYLGPGGINAKLFSQAKRIANRRNLDVKAEVTLLAYLYKRDDRNVVMGFIGLDCAGINIVSPNLKESFL